MMRPLLEDFVLLEMLHAEPTAPHSNPLSAYTQFFGGTAIRLEQERRILDCLAFIFAVTNDPLKVNALSLEQDEPHEACIIRVAMNTGVPESIMDAYESFARALEDASTAPNRAAAARNLLRTAVSINRNRILSRLRSSHASTSSRVPIISRLQSLMKVLSNLEQNTQTRAMEPVVADLVVSFAGLEAMSRSYVASGKGDEVLLHILSLTEQLPGAADLQSLTSVIPVDEFDGAGSLIATVTKLRNYKSSCVYLHIAALKFVIFRHVSVRGVDEALRVSARFPSGQTSLPRVLDRLNLSWSTDTSLKFRTTKDKASLQFRRRVSSLNTKVHAEIQLIYHYEMNPQLRRPHVICSSKNACFLCDTFVRAHGMFFISRTHSVVYPQWILPDPESLNLTVANEMALRVVVASFQQMIEAQIRDCWNGTRANRVHPSESIASLAAWTPAGSILQLVIEDAGTTQESSASGEERSMLTDKMPAGMGFAQSTTIEALSLHNVRSSAPTPVAEYLPMMQVATVPDSDLLENRAEIGNEANSARVSNASALQLSDESMFSIATPVPVEANIQPLHDLNCNLISESVAGIRDHEGRAYVMPDGCDVVPNTTLHPSDMARRIDFHDERINIALEIPESIIHVTIGEQVAPAPCGIVVDATTLSPGDEIVIAASEDTDGGRSIVIVDESSIYRKIWWKSRT